MHNDVPPPPNMRGRGRGGNMRGRGRGRGGYGGNHGGYMNAGEPPLSPPSHPEPQIMIPNRSVSPFLSLLVSRRRRLRELRVRGELGDGGIQ